MKTDATAKKELKETRKKIFWRLYVLPWLLLVTGLVIFSLYIIHEYKGLQHLQSESPIGCIEHGMEIVQKEAVAYGYGTWQVEPETLIVKFTWNESLNKIRSIEPVIVTNEIFKREYAFTYEDLKFADSLGMDLENDLVGYIGLCIHQVFRNNDTGIDLLKLERLLKEEVEKEIHKRFDGFETYKRMR